MTRFIRMLALAGASAYLLATGGCINNIINYALQNIPFTVPRGDGMTILPTLPGFWTLLGMLT